MATLPIHPIFLDGGDEFVVESVVEQLTERQELILKLIKASDVVGVVETAGSLAPKIDVSSRTVQREFAALQKMGRLSREGNDSDGRWIVHPKQ